MVSKFFFNGSYKLIHSLTNTVRLWLYFNIIFQIIFEYCKFLKSKNLTLKHWDDQKNTRK